MSGHEFPLGIVFLAGIVSFLSPCVLPIVPAYLSLISGLSFEELQAQDSVRGARWRLFGGAIAFILGFSIVSVLLLGGVVSLLVSALGDHGQDIIRWVGGAIVIIFALHLTGIFRLTMLYKEQRFHLKGKKFGLLGAMLIGAAFAFGWTPCTGPILGSVLVFAAGTSTPAMVWGNLIAYTLGLAVPFLLAAVFVNYFLGSLQRMTKQLRKIEIASGVLLFIMGILLITGQLSLISRSGGFLLDLSMKLEGLLQ